MNNATLDSALLGACPVAAEYAAALADVRRHTSRVTGLYEAITAAAQMSDTDAARRLTPYVLAAERDLKRAQARLAEVIFEARAT